MNNADGVIIKRCFFTGGITAIRLQESDDKKQVECRVMSCEFKNVETAMNIGGRTSAKITDCTYSGVRKNIVKGSNVRVTTK